MRAVHIDFETRSLADLPKVGAWNYSKHPSTEVLCCAYAFDEGPVATIGYHPSQIEVKELLDLAQDPEVIFYAHNAGFEQAIWKNQLEKGVWASIQFPAIPTARWRCTMAQSYMVGLPGKLEHVARILKLNQQKDMAGKKVMLSLSNAALPLPEALLSSDKFKSLLDYCKQDVKTERAIHKKLPPLPPLEQKVWELDQKINQTGILIDTQFVECITSEREKLIEQAKGEIYELTQGFLSSGSELVKMLTFLKQIGVEMPNLQSDTVAEYLKKELPEDARKILELRQLISGSASAKYPTFLQIVDKDDNRVRGCLQYHGAFTGRWSGRFIQPQNLPRPTLKRIDEAFEMIPQVGLLKTAETLGSTGQEILNSCIRGVLLPNQGERLVMIDYSSIECRVLMWLSQCEKGLSQYANKEDLYVEMAKVIFKDPTLTKADKDKRQLGKQAVLGCGYGMGVDKFYDTCLNAKVPGITPSLSQVAVSSYRTFYAPVKKLWQDLETTALNAARQKKSFTCGLVTFENNGAVMKCTLPSGRKLYYLGVKYIDDGYKGRLEYRKAKSGSPTMPLTSTWGGKLTENIVQAIARDLMADAMLKLDKIPGVTILLTVHDEVVMSVRDDVTTDFLAKEMVKLPEWAKGLPIEVEASEGKRYGK